MEYDLLGESIGNSMIRAREKRNWMIKEFIYEIGSVISPSYVTQLESDDKIPSWGLCHRIIHVYNFNPINFLKLVRDKKIKKYSNALDYKYERAYIKHITINKNLIVNTDEGFTKKGYI